MTDECVVTEEERQVIPCSFCGVEEAEFWFKTMKFNTVIRGTRTITIAEIRNVCVMCKRRGVPEKELAPGIAKEHEILLPTGVDIFYESYPDKRYTEYSAVVPNFKR